MDSSRAWGCCCLAAWLAMVGLCFSADAAAPKVVFKRAHRVGEISKVEVTVQVGGDLKLANEGQTKTIPMSVVANLKYAEQLLAVDAAGLPQRSLRHYDDAVAAIKVDKGGEKPTLDPARRLIVAERLEKSAPVLYAPSEPLRREELDLIDVPGNSLLLDQLLPKDSVAVGDSWKLTDNVLRDLLSLEAVSWSDVQVVLGEVKDNLADVAAAGSVQGAVGGVSTEIELKIKFKYDLKSQRIPSLGLLIKEKRSVGHIGPGLDTVAKVLIKISPLESSPELSKGRAALAKTYTPELAQLGYTSTGGNFRFAYDRRWFVTTDDPKLAVLRLLDRGELVAQCNVSALPVEAKKPLDLAEFQKDVERSLGKSFGQFVNATQGKTTAGYPMLRVVVRGTVSQLPIEWVYYLIGDESGQRISLAFTLEQDLHERFGQSDRMLVNALKIAPAPSPTPASSAEPSPPTASRPSTTK